MGTRGHLGGVAEATLLAGVIVDASGRDVLLYETVGVGQSEVEVAALADTVALVLMPGSGDSIQALKAGVMEIPDIIVVNKSDHPAIERTRAELAQVLSLAEPERRPVVIETVATAPSGIDELWAAVEAHQAALAAGGGLATRRTAQLRSELLALASARTARRLSEALDISPELQAIVEALAERRIDPLTAVQRLLDRT
jgi:LAO/AO transport system kinase